MQMPPPGEEHRKLQTMAGQWTGEEIMHPSPWNPQKTTAKSKINARIELGGFWVISDYIQERDGKESYRGHGVYGWDSNQKKFTMHWFDSMGCDPGAPATGTWQGSKLVFQHSHPMGHGRYTYEFVSPKEYKFLLEQSQDGKNWALFIEGKYKKAG